MTKINTIIIDDEQDSREIIRHYLGKDFPDIQVTGEAHSVQSALNCIAKKSPDLLFLDIHLPDGTGFDILEQSPHRNFDVVFISAYNQYTIDALKQHAFDYILKPFEQKEFNKTIRDYLARRPASGNAKALLELFANKQQRDKLPLPTLTGFKVVELNNIIYLKSEGAYTQFFFKEGSSILTSKYLKVYENMLPKDMFCRIHNSYIVNINFVKEYIKGRGGQVILEDNTTLNVAQNRRDDLMAFWR